MKMADIHILHQSDFYRVEDFKCHCEVCSVTAPEYNKSFSISFIRKGFFLNTRHIKETMKCMRAGY